MTALRESLLTAGLNLGGIPFALFGRRSFEPPQKVLILKPCCISQVLMATPLLAALQQAFPQAQFDWAVSRWARQAIVANPRVNNLVDSGSIGLGQRQQEDVVALIGKLRAGQYDTCIVPSRSPLLGYIAWRAGIRQRIGLHVNGRGFAYTLPVKPPRGIVLHESVLYLLIGGALGIESQAQIEFYPSDSDRSSIMGLVLERSGWQGVMPLVALHPGGGDNPRRPDERKRWPAERFALLAGRLSRKFGAHIVLLGSENERKLAETVAGLMAGKATNLAGQLTLGEVGALCEIADLYVGNDSGPTHVAAAVGCATLAIFGPSDPAVSGPLSTRSKITIVRPEKVSEPFSWDHGPSVDQVLIAAEALLGHRAPEIQSE